MAATHALYAAASERVDEITLSLDSRGHPVVAFAYPDKTQAIHFTDRSRETHQLVRSREWKADASCTGTMTPDQFVLTRCPKPRFTLSWDGVQRDRRYPPIIPLGKDGVLVFTQYLQTQAAGRYTPWRVIAPSGGVAVFRGEKSKDSLRIDGNTFARDARGWIYLGRDLFVNTDAALLYLEDGLNSVIADTIAESIPALLAVYTRELGTAAPKPSVYIAWINRTDAGGNFQADVVPGGVIRIGLSGARWGDATVNDFGTLRSLIAHEFAHLWNSNTFVSIDESNAWLHEGNAELLSIAAELKLGYITRAGAALRVERAIAACFDAADSKAWAMIDRRNVGRVPYVCGLAIQLAFLAATHQRDTTVHAFSFWRMFWQAYPRYTEADLVAFVSANRSPALADTTNRLLTDQTLTLEVAIRRILRETGISEAPTSLDGPRIELNRARLADLLVGSSK